MKGWDGAVESDSIAKSDGASSQAATSFEGAGLVGVAAGVALAPKAARLVLPLCRELATSV